MKDYDAHLAAINAYVAAWQRGEITTGEKRRAISDENLMFYGQVPPVAAVGRRAWR